MKILIIDRSPPCNLLQGNALIGQHLFRRLRHHHLTLICPAPINDIARYEQDLAELFDDVHLVPREKSIAALAGSLEPIAARYNFKYGNVFDIDAARAFRERVASVLRATSFDVIHTRQLPMAAVTGPINHPAKLLELIDSETLQAARRVRRNSPQTKARAIAARLVEQRALRSFHAVTTVAEADAQIIRRLAPKIPVHVTPNGVDAEFFAPLDMPVEPATILFFGAMSFPPNVSAVLHFYTHIFPIVKREMPGVHFVIAGRDPAPQIAALATDPAVTVTGMVDDMRPWLARSAVVLCPMVSGSGIKNKVLEAMAMARPVVSTTMGVEALEVSSGHEVIIADEPADFASSVVSLLRDQEVQRRIGASARALVLRRYTWDACAASYDALYSQLVAQQHTRTSFTPVQNKALK